MSLIYYVNETPIFEEEAKEKLYSGKLEKLDQALKRGVDFELQVENGSINSTDEYFKNFEPIGLGKPMSIEILTYYTGDAPKKFLGKKDLLLVSGVKSLTTHDAAPKAINQIVKKIDDYTHYEPAAFNQGSPIVYYTPALDMGTVLCSFELIADTFNESVFESVSSLLSKAGGIPVFAPASGILLAGSVISSMVANLGKAVFESKPFFKGNIDIRLDSPGQLITKSKHVGVIDPRHVKEFNDYVPKRVSDSSGSQIKLVHKNSNKEYNGDAPYVLLSINGANKDEEYKGFSPSLATASILEKFYGTESGSQTIEVLQDAMELYNDYSFYKKAKKQKERISSLNQNSNEYKNGKLLLDAYLKNIANPIFKNSFKL
jgi:hypothetical protein